jgi:hypothetical protein
MGLSPVLTSETWEDIETIAELRFWMMSQSLLVYKSDVWLLTIMICSAKEGFKILGTTWQKTVKEIHEPRVLGFIIVQGITRPWTLNPFKQQQQQQQVLRFNNDFQAGFKIILLLTCFCKCKSQQPKPLLLACCEPFKEEDLQLSRHCRMTDCNQAMIKWLSIQISLRQELLYKLILFQKFKNYFTNLKFNMAIMCRTRPGLHPCWYMVTT